MRYIAIGLIILCTALGASDAPQGLSVLMEKLDSEDFNVRQAASAELADYPEEYVEKFMEMALAENDRPEVQYRLRNAAKDVFYSTVVLKDEAFLKYMGHIGFEAQYYRWPLEGTWGYVKQLLHLGDVAGVVVVNPTDTRFKRHDLVVAINGKQVSTSPGPGTWVKAGETVVLTVRRYPDPNIGDRLKYNKVLETELDYVTLNIEVVVGWKTQKNAPQYYDYYSQLALRQEEALWDGFLKEFQCKHPIPEASDVQPSRLRGVRGRRP